MDDGPTDPLKKNKARDDAIGCGCMIGILAGLGPVVAYFVGLPAWTVAALLGAAATGVFYKKMPFESMTWQAFGSLFVIGAVGAAFVASLFGADTTSTSTSSPTAQPTQTPAPQPIPEAIPIREQKEEVRTSIDDILRMFADNQVKGARYFDTRTALIEGRVVRVREALGTGILVLRSLRSTQTIEMGFSERGTMQLAEVKPGDRVQATCPEVNEMLGEVIIACSDIEIIKK